MAYIGKSPVIGNFVKLDAITAVNGQAAYTMQNGGSNFTDYESVNQFLVSLNGTIQAPTDSFTVSGSTLTFASNLSTGDVIDFVIIFGNSLSAGVPTDATVSTAKIVDDAVTAAKINNDIISGSTELASEPADTDEFLVSDAGTLKRIDYSLIKGGGATELLHTATGSNVSSIDINGYFTSDYDHYKLIYSVYAATSNTDAMVRIMEGGSVISSSNYWFAGQAWYYDGSTSQASQAVGFNTNYIGISSTDGTADSRYPTTGEIILSNPLSTAHITSLTTNSIGYNSVSPPTAIRTWNYAGAYNNPGTATSGISFGYMGGNIHGTIRLYGMKNS